MTKNLEMLKALVAEMAANGVQADEKFCEALEIAENPKIKIAIVGKFQAGKSHIINKLFLGENPLLQEGHGMCMSAIPVSITYGDTPNITLLNKKNNEILSISNPDREKIAPLIAAEDDESREEIFNTFENVELRYPNSCLQDVTVLDTPGIDDPNEHLLRETTYKVLPDADVIVMVIEPRSLSKPELAFLQRKVFSTGLNRFMMVISCKPQNLLNEAGLEGIVQSVKGQLASIGKSDIPVYIYSDSDPDCFLDNKTDCLRDKILAFARNYSAENRYSKIARLIEKHLREEMCKLELQSAVFGKNQNELNSMKIKAVERLNEMRSALSEFFNEFEARATVRRNNCQLGFESDLNGIKVEFLKKLHELEDMSDTQEAVALADSILVPRIEDAAVLRINQFQHDIEDVFKVMKKDLHEHWHNQNFSADLGELDGGWIQNWNSLWVTIGDYLVSMFVLPGGWFRSLGLRFILGKIPVVKELMPTNLLTSHLIDVAGESLTKHLEHISSDFKEELSALQGKIADFLREEGEKEISHQQLILETIRTQEETADTQTHIMDIQSRIGMITCMLERLS